MRKNPKLSGTTHNVFGIQVGVGITILVRNAAARAAGQRFIKYHRVPEFWRKGEKLDWLAETVSVEGIEWQTLAPNRKNAWLTEGLEADFDEFVPLGTKAAKASFSADSKTIFKTYSLGVSTNRDGIAYDFNQQKLENEIRAFAEEYNGEVTRWQSQPKKDKTSIDDFVSYTTMKWSRNLKRDLRMGKEIDFDPKHIRPSLYRPFCKMNLYFADTVIDERGAWPKILPQEDPEFRAICVSNAGNSKPFHCLMTDCIPDLHLTGDSQCFPLYTYSADGSERFDNVTGFALQAARAQWGDSVSREDIFYATYALLHAPSYRTKFAENLKRELPRLPLDALPLDAAQWARLVEIGRALGDLHVGYENAPPHPLANRNTTPDGVPFSHRVEKMRWRDDKAVLQVNASIELSGFSAAMFDYRLGNRSALDWVVESYRVKEDARSGLTSDPNRADNAEYIVDLIARVATVSLQTCQWVGELPDLFGDGD